MLRLVTVHGLLGQAIGGNHTLLDARSCYQRSIARRCRDIQPRRVKVAPTLRHGLQPLFRTTYQRRVSALGGAEHSIADLVCGCLAAWEGGRSFEDLAAKFGAGNPGERRLVLVFAPDL